MSSLQSKVDETRLRSKATPMAVEEDSRMNLLPDVDMEDLNNATRKRKRKAIDENIEDTEYSVPCDMCGASIVAKDTEMMNKMKYLQSLDNRDEMMQCTSCAYDEETNRAAKNLYTEYQATTVPTTAMISALEASGIPPNILGDVFIVERLQMAVKGKIKKIQPKHEYKEETSCAANLLYSNATLYSCRLPKKAIDEALQASGIPSNIIHSKNSIDVSLMANLHNMVKQKIKEKPRRKHNKSRRQSSKNSLEPRMSTDERILEATRLANRMACPGKKGVFQAPVCIVCDYHIIGTEEICYLTKEDLLKNEKRIGVKSYDDFYTKASNGGYSKLPLELVEQYEVDGMKGLLLSRRSRHAVENGIDTYEACQSCYNSIKKSFNNKSPPKFSIANGYVGQIPGVFEISDKDGTKRKVVVDENKITDIVRAMLAPTRAYGYTFSYFAGAQQSIQGHYTFYEVDQTHMGSVMNNIQQSGANPHVHIVLGGRFTPSQKRIVRERTAVDTKLVTDLLTWFIQKSGHKGFAGFKPPAECLPPKMDEEIGEDYEVDSTIERQFDGGTYYFSSANAPSSDTGVYGTQLKFAKSLLERTPPTLLAYGGDYTSSQSLKLENAIPSAFPWGRGGPDMSRRTPASLEACLKHYGRISLPQFMKGDFCLLASHMLDRRLSYTSGKVKCRSNIDGMPLAEKISLLTVKDLEDVVSGANTNSTAIQLLSSVSASCKAMGHTSEAAAYWRRIYFALNDRHGLNPFMLTVTPNDLASFSVRVIALAGEEVRVT